MIKLKAQEQKVNMTRVKINDCITELFSMGFTEVKNRRELDRGFVFEKYVKLWHFKDEEVDFTVSLR
jgi:hypothetical protein